MALLWDWRVSWVAVVLLACWSGLGSHSCAGHRGQGEVAAGEVVPRRCVVELGGQGPQGVRLGWESLGVEAESSCRWAHAGELGRRPFYSCW